MHGKELYSQHRSTLSSKCDFLKNLLSFCLLRSKENDPFSNNYHFTNVLKVTFTPSAAVAISEHSSWGWIWDAGKWKLEGFFLGGGTSSVPVNDYETVTLCLPWILWLLNHIHLNIDRWFNQAVCVDLNWSPLFEHSGFFPHPSRLVIRTCLCAFVSQGSYLRSSRTGYKSLGGPSMKKCLQCIEGML